MTTLPTWLRCTRCEVVWQTATAEPCWLCAQPGDPTRHPLLTPGTATQTFERGIA